MLGKLYKIHISQLYQCADPMEMYFVQQPFSPCMEPITDHLSAWKVRNSPLSHKQDHTRLQIW